MHAQLDRQPGLRGVQIVKQRRQRGLGAVQIPVTGEDGIIETEPLRALPYLKGIEERSKAAMPIKRFGSVEEVADLVAFLASSRAGFISGEVVHISGGRYG
jgi:NAD(P)-dependent dehydrogenase (short-subunit alcohol dehydrogenase family)